MRGLDAVGFRESGAANQVRRAVGRSAVGIDHDGPQAGEVARERLVHGADDVHDGGRVVERREPDENVNLPDGNQLPQQDVWKCAIGIHI
jgi:hypothetical protein